MSRLGDLPNEGNVWFQASGRQVDGNHGRSLAQVQARKKLQCRTNIRYRHQEDTMTDWNEVTTVESTTGASIAIRHMPAKGKARAAIHIHHGLAEHSTRYERFATALSSAGYHAYAHDHRGHGETTATDAPQGVFSDRDGLEKVLADMHAVNTHIRSFHPALPVILFGHSMGGILGTNYCIRHSDRLDGAILWNFNVDGGFACRPAINPAQDRAGFERVRCSKCAGEQADL